MKKFEGFEIDDNELESLRDKEVAPKALSIFYGALLNFNIVNDADAVVDIFENAHQNLLALYDTLPSFETDYLRMEGQLVRCYYQKVKELRGPLKVQFEIGKLSSWENQEFESMRDKELRTLAKRIYCLGKHKLSSIKNSTNILVQRDLIADELKAVYESNEARDDLSKWIFMLDSYLQGLVDKKTRSLPLN